MVVNSLTGPPPTHQAPGVEMEGDLPSGDSLPVNPRNSVNTAGSASESHLEQRRSTLKLKPSLDNVTCAKSIGDSKMNFGKMQEFASANTARYKTTPTKAIHALPTLNGSVKTNTNGDLENATIQKQRNELQLLVAELKDRDKELNEMVAAHQKQLLAWEEDRLRILSLEERCAKVEYELRNRNEMIRNLNTQQKILECQQADCIKTLNCTQQKLKEMSEKAAEYAKNCKELEDRNKSLNSSVMELSAQVGQLQAREQELTTMLELKDKDMVEASNHIMDLTARFKTLEGALREARLNETNSRKEVHDCKQHSKKLRHEICKLKDELDEKTVENNEQREEIIRLKQERQYLGNELTLAVEREKRKDQILELARSKQERADTELHGLRQVNEKQQHDLQLLHLNLESSQDLIQRQEEKILEISSGRFFSQNNNGQNKVKGQEHQDNIVLKEWTKESTKDFKAEPITNRHVEAAAKSTQNLDAEFIPIGTKEQGHLSVTEDRNTLNCRNYSSSDFANGDCANGQVASPLEFDQCTNANLKGKTKSLHFNTNEPNKHPTKYVEPKQDCRYTKASDCGSPQGRENGMQQVSRKQKWRFEGLVDGSTMEHENVAYINTDHCSPSCGTSSHCKAGTVSTSTDNHHSLCSKLSATSVASTKESGKASENHNLEDKYSNEMIECGINEEMPLLPAENETDQEASMSEQNWMKLYERAIDVKDMWWLYLNDGSGSSCGLGTPIGVEKKSDERLEVNAYGLESPLRSKNSTPVKEMPRRKSSLHDELCVNDSPARLSSTEDNTMKSSNNAYRDDCSPTSKLQRLLAESRQMVASLDRNTQLPLGLSSCPTNNSKARDGGSL